MSTRTAVITGAARGIGAATAKRLRADGWSLVLVDRCADDPSIPYPLATVQDLEAVVEACGGTDQVLPVVADVRDQAALDGAVGAAVERFGGIDAGVAAAGCVVGGQAAWATDDLAWSTMLGVNLEGVWRLARATVPAMLARPEPREGRFVAVSSMGGSVGLPLLSAYVAAKHAVNGLVRSMAAELGPHGITANAVAPGSTTTAMLEASALVYGLPDASELSAQHLLGRPLDPAEVAEAITWLCSGASSGITGTVLPVDAGATSR